MKQARIKVSGKVQGVFFRAHARDKALELGLSGYARNLPDGTVEILAQGEEQSIKNFIHWCSDGSPAAKVEKVETVWGEVAGDIRGFDTY